MNPNSALPCKKLGSTSVEVPALGCGAATLGNLYRAISDEQAQATLAAAFSSGLTYVDTAPHYGQGLSERRVGNSLAKGILVSTKVGRVLNPIASPPPGTERHGFVDGDPFEPEFDYSYDGIMRSFEASQKRLNREYIDILLVHDLGHATHNEKAPRHMSAFLSGGYKAMQSLKDQGLTGAIGIGVNEWQVCEDLMSQVSLDVILLAGRYTLLEQTALDSFLPACEHRNISIILGGPFNSGILIEGITDTRVPHYNYEPAPPEIVGRVRALQSVCEAHGVPLAAAALQFPLAHPAVASVIPGMASADQVRANRRLLDTFIPSALWSDLRTEGLLHPLAPVSMAERVAS